MHLSLHKKAYRDILLIANGHEVYKNDLSKFVQNIPVSYTHLRAHET